MNFYKWSRDRIVNKERCVVEDMQCIPLQDDPVCNQCFNGVLDPDSLPSCERCETKIFKGDTHCPECENEPMEREE